MTHILSGEGDGSGDTLMEAIVSAINSAIAEAGANGDHQLSITVIVDGYEFDGTKYRAKVKVSIQDFNLEQEDIYHEEAAELENRRETSEAVSSAFYASAAQHQNNMDQYERVQEAEQQMEHMMGGTFESANIDAAPSGDANAAEGQSGIILYAPADVHERLDNEIMEQRAEAKHDHDAPEFNIDGAGPNNKGKEAA